MLLHWSGLLHLCISLSCFVLAWDLHIDTKSQLLHVRCGASYWSLNEQQVAMETEQKEKMSVQAEATVQAQAPAPAVSSAAPVLSPHTSSAAPEPSPPALISSPSPPASLSAPAPSPPSSSHPAAQLPSRAASNSSVGSQFRAPPPPDYGSDFQMPQAADSARPIGSASASALLQSATPESLHQTITAEPKADVFTPVVSNPPQPEHNTPTTDFPPPPSGSIPGKEVRPVTSSLSDKLSESEEAKRLVSQANICQRQEDFKGALVFYGLALEHARNTELKSATLFNRSVALARLLRWEESLQDANDCVSMNPTWSRGPECQGTALEGLGRLHEALAAFEAALDLDPQNQVRFFFSVYAFAMRRSSLPLRLTHFNLTGNHANHERNSRKHCPER